LRAIANPDKHLHVMFETLDDPVEVMEELATDSLTFALRGHLTSGNLRGPVFAGTYDVSSPHGRLILKRT